MNEVQKIHISRQAYTIAVDAYGELKKYLDALQKKINDDEVYAEIEQRIVELLAEHRSSVEDVIVKDDITYLKQNLGELSDFEDGEERTESVNDLPKRMMRNPKGQVLGGVSSGLASYFGIDPMWFRLAFIGLTFSGGVGILIYLILWIVMPEAKTSSDFIQMQGKPVTAEAITEFAESRKLDQGMHRATGFMRDVLRFVGKATLLAIAIGFLVAGVVGAIATVGGSTLIFTYGKTLFDGIAIFPVGAVEVATVIAAAVAGLVISLLMLVAGASVLARRWRLPVWATAGLVTLFFVSVTAVIPLTAASVPRVSERVDNAYVTKQRPVSAFQKLTVVADERVDIAFETSDEYSVQTKVFGNKDTSLIKTTVTDGVLAVNTDEYSAKYRCQDTCIFNNPPQIIVRAPGIDKLELNGSSNFDIRGNMKQSSLEIIKRGNGRISANYIYAQKLSYFADDDRVLLEGLSSSALESDTLMLHPYSKTLYIKRVDTLNIVGTDPRGCAPYENIVEVVITPTQVTVDSVEMDADTLHAVDTLDLDSDQRAVRSSRNCVVVTAE